jgi:RNA polymerase sigma factor (sigma-70 family)
MAENRPDPLLHHIRHLIGSDPAADTPDSQLLDRFLVHRDETAVEVLVRRYGPLVFGVCRRILRNSHAAEDAFQATFLVLMRKAPALVRCERLGGWLYRVAYRLALRARANEARRQKREAQAARNEADAESHASNSSDLLVALEEELQKLPERHRVPLVLCYLEGKTNEQAAQVLGCPRGSISARVAQARERLRGCLAQRGYVVPSAGVPLVMTSATAEAAVPLPLLTNTVRAALWFAREEAATTDFVTTQAVALARGVCRAMFVNKLKIAAALLLTVAMLGAGATVLLRAAPQADPPAQIKGQLPPNERPENAEDSRERLPMGALARMGTTRLRHGDAVFFASYTPDGKALVTAGRDRTVRLWDVATAKEIHRFEWTGGQPDSKAELSRDGPFEKQQQQMLDDIALSCQAALSADGKFVAVSRGGLACLWETASGKMLRHFQTGQQRLVHLAFSSDGKSLVTLGPSARVVAVWEVATGKCLRESQAEMPAGYARDGSVPFNEQNAVVSPGWKHVAFQWREPSGNRQIHIRELATGKEMPPIHVGGYGGALSLCFSADEKTLMWDDWYTGGGIVFSDVITGKELRRLGDRRSKDGTYLERTEQSLAIALSPDGKSLAVCRQSHTIELWDLRTGKSIYPAGEPTTAQLYDWFPDSVGAYVRPALAFSPDGKKLVSSLGGASIRQFHVDTGKVIPEPGDTHRAPVLTLALSADGKSLASFGSGDPVRFWDWATGKEVRQEGLPASATHAVFAREGRFAFAVGNQITYRGNDGTKTWRIADGEFPPLLALALAPDAAVLATRSYDNPEIHLWDARGKHLRSLGRLNESPTFVADGLRETAGVVAPDILFSPDGRRLAGAGPRRQLCLWDVDTGDLIWELPLQAGQVIERFAFSPGGHLLACVQSNGTVTLYETVSSVRRAQFGEADPKNQRVYLAYFYYGRARMNATRRATPVCLAFSPDGRYLATAKDTPSIHLWDVVNGQKVGQLTGHEGRVVSLLFAPDGKQLFSGSTDTTVLAWDLGRFTNPPPSHATRLSEQAQEALWSDLASNDAAHAFTAIRKLCASPEQAVALLRQRIRLASPPDPQRLARLLTDLESPRFELRRKAESELEQLGELAEPALRQALAEGPPLNLRQRLERLLDLLKKAPPGGKLRELRAVEVLEMIDNSAARELLKELAGGVPGADLTCQARSASQRLTIRAVRP